LLKINIPLLKKFVKKAGNRQVIGKR